MAYVHKLFFATPKRKCVATPFLEECEDDTHIPEMGSWESFETPKTSEFDCKGQKTLPWGVLHDIGNLLKRRCQKWPCMSHLDICSTSYGKKKGWESTQPWCVQVECDTPLKSSQGELQVFFRPHPNHRSEQIVMNSQSPRNPNQDNFKTLPWEFRDKKPFRCGCHRVTQRILYGGRWWLPPSPGHGESCESKVLRGLSLYQGCSRMRTNQLVGWFDACSSE
jgi:hypothetical protein